MILAALAAVVVWLGVGVPAVYAQKVDCTTLGGYTTCTYSDRYSTETCESGYGEMHCRPGEPASPNGSINPMKTCADVREHLLVMDFSHVYQSIVCNNATRVVTLTLTPKWVVLYGPIGGQSALLEAIGHLFDDSGYRVEWVGPALK
jgi:hypothetical protein